MNEQERAGSISTFGRSGGESGLSDKGGLLVTGNPSDRSGDAEETCSITITDHAIRGDDLGEGVDWHPEKITEPWVPSSGVEVVQHGSGGVGGIGNVLEATCYPRD